ncbi:chorismate mutase [Marinisporobacter balticus]|uniref:Bifunctional chorismate mutase/prephenate dehydratase n=1 Tax=Marinisporobacter balticus TaxID=2018667 RepID=A0A4R2L3W1_9FIRM|nr:chorismate mutase [Marinisporobacter balticus]TCO73815.1 chorismate mutase [Marinisporobacter balticus]
MDALGSMRKEIDQIDKEMVKLFEKRMETALKIAEYKKNNDIPVFNGNREEQVIKKNILHIKNKNLQKSAEVFLNSMMAISRKIQESMIVRCIQEEKDCKTSISEKCPRIGFQGVGGSFSEQALMEYFGDSIITKNVNQFKDVFEALKNNEIDYGVLPIENSSTGGISQVYDLLRKYGCYIVGERCIKVEHQLLGIKGTKLEDIIEVYSHPQAFEQSSEFFRTHRDWKIIPYSNTAMSAKFIKDENIKTKAAVASIKAAKLYGLDIIQSNINDNKSNYTRFIVIGKNLEIHPTVDKISVVVATPHKAGALYSILRYFSENNLNMLKIESRPMIDRSWEYFFYIDFEGNLNEEVVKEAIELIKENSSFFQLLGNYKGHKR